MNHLSSFRGLLFALLAIVLVTACDDDEGPAVNRLSDPESNIFELLDSLDNVDTLRSVLQQFPQLSSAVQGTNKTLFAPTNAAFTSLKDAIGANTLAEINPNILFNLLFYHTLNEQVRSTELGDSVVTDLGNDETIISIRVSEGANGPVLNEGVQANPANFVEVDIQASNGFIHIIDEILFPPIPLSFEAEPRLTQSPAVFTLDLNNLAFGTIDAYLALTNRYQWYYFFMQQAGLDNSEEFLAGSTARTLIAPDDQFFLQGVQPVLPQNLTETTLDSIVRYYVLEEPITGVAGLPDDDGTLNTLLAGDPLYFNAITNSDGTFNFVNDVQLADPGIVLNNGNLLICFDVLVPPSLIGQVTEPIDSEQGSFNVFRAALEAEPEVRNLLEDDDNYTIFAPTDAAFENLDITAENVAQTENLRGILEEHVFPSLVFLPELQVNTEASFTNVKQNTIRSVINLENQTINLVDNNDTSPDATVTTAFFQAENGILYGINEVLLPQ